MSESPNLRIVDEIRLLRVESYEEYHREHLANQVERLILAGDELAKRSDQVSEQISDKFEFASEILDDAVHAWQETR